MIKGGYKGKILRIDLTTRSITYEGLPSEEILRKYIGNRGLGLWYLYHMLKPGIRASDPENPMIFLNGPLLGTRISSSTNCTLVSLNMDTECTAGRSHSHGWFGVNLNRCGLDGMIITGASDKWVYLWINDDKIELRDATKLLGKDTHETEDLVKMDLGLPLDVGHPDGASVGAIGPAGENLCAGASIMNDKNHGFCHSGVGAVMGSKKLKAIAIRGTGELTKVSDPEKLAAVAKEWTKAAFEKGFVPVVAKGMSSLSDYMGVKSRLGVSANNLLVNDMPDFGPGFSKQKITSRPCWHCPIGCSYDAEAVEGPYKGYVSTLSGGGENMEGSSAIVGISGDPGTIWYMTDLNDRLGFDSSTVGCSMAVAFEAYEKCLITKEDTDGLELKWGDVEVVKTLITRIAHRDGKFASSLADGILTAAQRVGLPECAVHVKNSGMNLHDWRSGGFGPLLGQIVGGGSGWFATGADVWAPEADAGYPQQTEPFETTGKGKEVGRTAAIKAWHDCYGCCWFISVGVPGILGFSASAIAAVVGWEDFSSEEAFNVGFRTLTLERIIDLRLGMTVEDDINASPRLTDGSPPDALRKGKCIRPYLEGMVRDYYESLGWDRKTSKPNRKRLIELGMEEFIEPCWGC